MGLLRMSLVKLGRRPASWVVLLIALGLIAVFFLALAASPTMSTDSGDELQVRLMLGFPTAYVFLISMILSLGGLLGVVYGAAVIGSEWSAGTIRSVVARGESRIRFTLVTFIAIAIAVFVGLAVLFGLGIVLAIFAAEMAGFGSSGATDADTLASFPDLIARAWLGLVTQTSIGFAIAMLFRSQLAGIGVGLLLYFGAIFLALVPPARDVVPYLPFNVANAVVSPIEGLGDGGFGSIGSIDSDMAVLVAAVYIAVALVVASLAAWRAQITQ